MIYEQSRQILQCKVEEFGPCANDNQRLPETDETLINAFDFMRPIYELYINDEVKKDELIDLRNHSLHELRRDRPSGAKGKSKGTKKGSSKGSSGSNGSNTGSKGSGKKKKDESKKKKDESIDDPPPAPEEDDEDEEYEVDASDSDSSTGHHDDQPMRMIKRPSQASKITEIVGLKMPPIKSSIERFLL